MQIFVISLIGHARRNTIRQNLQELNIDFEFFDAVDGSNLSKAHRKLIDLNQAEKNIPAGLTDSECACALSHALIYQKIATEKIPHALILEDDASAPNDLKLILDACALENSGFDLVMLCYANAWSRRWSFKSFFKQYQSFKLWNAPDGAVAYYINNKAAESLSRVALPIASVADWPIGAFKNINTACLHPQVIVHPKASLDGSMLEKERRAKKVRYKVRKKKLSLFSTCKRKVLTTFFLPKHSNNQLPHFWLQLLGKKTPGQ